MNKATIAALAFALLYLANPHNSKAAEVRVLSSLNMKPIFGGLSSNFEHSTGHHLTINYDTAGPVKRRISGGEPVDIVVVLKSLLDDLVREGKVAQASATNIARSSVVLAVREGSPKPDIGSVESFKRAMLGASSIAFTDPKSGGLSGKYFAAALERLGITAQLESKIKLVGPAAAIKLVSQGGAEFGVDQLSNALKVQGIAIVGALPKELQTDIVVSAGLVVGSTQPDAATTFIKFLSSPPAAAIIKKGGMEPG